MFDTLLGKTLKLFVKIWVKKLIKFNSKVYPLPVSLFLLNKLYMIIEASLLVFPVHFQEKNKSSGRAALRCESDLENKLRVHPSQYAVETEN